jgi:rRNA maturation protein Rpf1
MRELADACRANDITDLIILHEHRGIPGQYQAITTLDAAADHN